MGWPEWGCARAHAAFEFFHALCVAALADQLELGLEVAPVKGHAVFFSYDRPDPATRTLHGGAPVLAGEKWVATKWLRERRFE